MTVDRERAALEAIVDAILPRLRYHIQWEYRVQSVEVVAGPPRMIRVNCKATVAEMPDLVGIVIWPGPDGSYCEPAIGSSVRVGFVNADPTRPAIMGCDPASPPTAITLGTAGDFVALAGKVAQLQSAYNAHKHTGVTPGAGTSAVTDTPNATSFGSTVVKAAS